MKIRENPWPRISSSTRNDLKSVETEIKYAGYLLQQQRAIDRLKKAEQHNIPQWFDYGSVSGLSREMQEILVKIRPRTLGHASRIPGVTPAAVSLVHVYIEIQASAANKPPPSSLFTLFEQTCHPDRSSSGRDLCSLRASLTVARDKSLPTSDFNMIKFPQCSRTSPKSKVPLGPLLLSADETVWLAQHRICERTPPRIPRSRLARKS